MSTATTQTIQTPETTANAPAAEVKVDPARPTWLPEKFKSPEDMAKAYGELEKKLGTPEKPATPAPTTEKPATEKPANEPADKLDFSKYTAEIEKNGKLGDASYAELEAKGFPKSVVDAYVTGQEAVRTQQANEIYSTVGGEQNFKAMIEWAGKNLSEAEKTAYNNSAKAGDVAAIKLAVAGMNARFTAAYGSNPKFVGGTTSTQTGPAPFRSWHQVTEAMNNSKYQNDPAYRKDVSDRLAVSQI